MWCIVLQNNSVKSKVPSQILLLLFGCNNVRSYLSLLDLFPYMQMEWSDSFTPFFFYLFHIPNCRQGQKKGVECPQSNMHFISDTNYLIPTQQNRYLSYSFFFFPTGNHLTEDKLHYWEKEGKNAPFLAIFAEQTVNDLSRSDLIQGSKLTEVVELIIFRSTINIYSNLLDCELFLSFKSK